MATISLTASPTTLQHSAMLKTSIFLWHHRIHHDKPTSFLHFYKPFPVDEIPLPNVLRKRLHTYLKSITDQIWDWMRFQSRNIFKDKSMSYSLSYLKYLVWYQDGTIDYITTAQNLLQDPILNHVEQLNIAIVYFFIEFINETYPYIPNSHLKSWFTPLEKFETFKELARSASGYDLLRIHKKMAKFLDWYFSDKAAIIAFTFPRLLEVQGASDETLVRTLLLGLGDRVPLPVLQV